MVMWLAAVTVNSEAGPPAVMAEADAALYEAKLGGRDRMAIAASKISARAA